MGVDTAKAVSRPSLEKCKPSESRSLRTKLAVNVHTTDLIPTSCRKTSEAKMKCPTDGEVFVKSDVRNLILLIVFIVFRIAWGTLEAYTAGTHERRFLK